MKEILTKEDIKKYIALEVEKEGQLQVDRGDSSREGKWGKEIVRIKNRTINMRRK